MPIFVSETCSKHNIDLANAFYKDRAANYAGMERGFEIAMATSEQCLSLKNRYQADFTNYLNAASLN